MVKKKTSRNPEGVTKSKIIQSISLSKEGKKRFSDLKKELSISKPMLAEHLKTLKEEEKITSLRIGREVFYSLTDEEWKRAEIRIALFSSSLFSFINREIEGLKQDEKRLWKISDEQFVNELSGKLGILALFTIIKSYETQDDWYKAAMECIEQLTMGGSIYRRLMYPKPGFLLKDEVKGHPDVKAKIDDIYKAMRKAYPREVKVMEQVCQNPRVLEDPDTGEKLFEYSSPPEIYEFDPKKKKHVRKL